jgi:hypothetical protein
MMKGHVRLLAVVLGAFWVTGCVSSGPHINGGFLFTLVEGPVTSTNSGGSDLKGSACAINVLGLVAVGDNSIETAKRSAGIKVVSSVDYSLCLPSILSIKQLAPIRSDDGDLQPWELKQLLHHLGAKKRAPYREANSSLTPSVFDLHDNNLHMNLKDYLHA